MKILVSLLMSLLFMPLGFAQYQQKTEVRAELVDRYPVKFTFRFLLDGEIQEFEKIYECRVIEVNRYYQGKVVKVERKALEWDTNGRYKNIDHILEDGSAIRLKFSRSSLAQGCPRDGQKEEVNWAEYVKDYFKDNRWLPDVYWVDSMNEPNEAFVVSASNYQYDLREKKSLYFTPIGYAVTRLDRVDGDFDGTELARINSLECVVLGRAFPGRKSNLCALRITKFARIYVKQQWSNILPLRDFLIKQKQPIFLDPFVFAEIRPLYSYSESPNDSMWREEQPEVGGAISKDVFQRWRGVGTVWRPVSGKKLHLDKINLYNRVSGRLIDGQIWDLATSSSSSYLYYGGNRLTRDPFYLREDEELADQMKLMRQFSKVKIGSKVFDLEDYREFSEKNRFGLYFYDPETEYLIHTYR